MATAAFALWQCLLQLANAWSRISQEVQNILLGISLVITAKDFNHNNMVWIQGCSFYVGNVL